MVGCAGGTDTGRSTGDCKSDNLEKVTGESTPLIELPIQACLPDRPMAPLLVLVVL